MLAKTSIEGCFNDCIDKWCNKHDVDKSILTEWKYKFVGKVDEKIKNCPKIHLPNIVKLCFGKNNHYKPLFIMTLSLLQ